MNEPNGGRSLALLADLEAAGAISVTGLMLSDPNLPYDQYEALGVLLGKMHEAVRFAIGDFIILGESLYRELAYQAIEAMGLSVDARREYVRVAQQVPRSVRREDSPGATTGPCGLQPGHEDRERVAAIGSRRSG